MNMHWRWTSPWLDFCLNSIADPLDFFFSLCVCVCACMLICLFHFGVVSGLMLLYWKVRGVFSSSLSLVRHSSLKTVGYSKD